MILVICSVRDSAVDAFMQPFFVQHSGAAIRSFMDEVTRRDTPFHAHPDDFILFELGTFDDSTGCVTMLERPRQLSRGTDLKERPNETSAS